MHYNGTIKIGFFQFLFYMGAIKFPQNNLTNSMKTDSSITQGVDFRYNPLTSIT